MHTFDLGIHTCLGAGWRLLLFNLPECRWELSSSCISAHRLQACRVSTILASRETFAHGEEGMHLEVPAGTSPMHSPCRMQLACSRLLEAVHRCYGWSKGSSSLHDLDLQNMSLLQGSWMGSEGSWTIELHSVYGERPRDNETTGRASTMCRAQPRPSMEQEIPVPGTTLGIPWQQGRETNSRNGGTWLAPCCFWVQDGAFPAWPAPAQLPPSPAPSGSMCTRAPHGEWGFGVAPPAPRQRSPAAMRCQAGMSLGDTMRCHPSPEKGTKGAPGCVFPSVPHENPAPSVAPLGTNPALLQSHTPHILTQPQLACIFPTKDSRFNM